MHCMAALMMSMYWCWQDHLASRAAAVPVMQCFHTVHLLMENHHDKRSSHAGSSIPRPQPPIAPQLCSMRGHLPARAALPSLASPKAIRCCSHAAGVI